MDKLNAMKTFVNIVKLGSLTKAAEEMNTSLPTVVRTLKNLESFFNVRLLNRTTRTFTLSSEGEYYFKRSQEILEEIENTETELNAIHSSPKGGLRITSSVMYGTSLLMPIVNKFINNYPNLRVDLQLEDRNMNLVEHGIDVAIRIGKLEDSSMVARKVGSLRRMICGTPRFLNAQPNIEHPRDLIAIPCIHFSGLDKGRDWVFHEKGKVQRVGVNGPFKSNNVLAVLEAVKAHMGLGMFLSYQVASSLKSGELVTVLSEFEPSPLEINVVYPSAKMMSSRVRLFVEWITKELSELNRQ